MVRYVPLVSSKVDGPLQLESGTWENTIDDRAQVEQNAPSLV